MRILFLDDATERHRRATELLIGHDVNYTWTADEAIAALTLNERFDVALLDHDLGGQVYTHDMVAGPEGNGQLVAAYIALMPNERQPRFVVIHSFNPTGAMRMYHALEANGYEYGRNLVYWPWLRMGTLYPIEMVHRWLNHALPLP